MRIKIKIRVYTDNWNTLGKTQFLMDLPNKVKPAFFSAFGRKAIWNLRQLLLKISKSKG